MLRMETPVEIVISNVEEQKSEIESVCLRDVSSSLYHMEANEFHETLGVKVE